MTLANPPANADIFAQMTAHERALLACVAGNITDTLTEAGWLAGATFQDPALGDLWDKVKARGPDVDGLWQIAQAAGLAPTVTECLTEAQSWAYANWHAEELVKLRWLLTQNATLAGLGQAVARGDYRTVAAQLAHLQETQPTHTGAPAMRDLGDAGCTFLTLLDSGLRSIPTGIPLLDKATAGLERQSQTILAAAPSTGKSALAFQIARNVAAAGHKALFFSLEMSEANLFARAVCGEAGTTWLDVRRGNITAAQNAKVRELADELILSKVGRLQIHDQPIDIAGIWRRVEAHRPDVFVVDHIRFVTDEHGETDNKRLGWISQQLRIIANRFDCHCLLLSQLSRSSKERSDKRPILSDLRDSGELEENADNVWMLHVPVDGTSTIANRSIVEMEVWLRKARDGVRDACVYLQFDRRRQWLFGKDAP